MSPKLQPESISLEQFLLMERVRLEAFEQMWKANMTDNPKDYPGKMLPGDWDEQLEAWRTS